VGKGVFVHILGLRISAGRLAPGKGTVAGKKGELFFMGWL
jgi:hypothetical protein